MLSKQLEKVYREPFLSNAGVSFNTNDSMVVTGNNNGDLIVRNLLNPEGDPLHKNLGNEPMHESGVSEVILTHGGEKSEVTQAKFSVVKRHILASAYKNGQVVIWDTSNIFTKGYNNGLSQTCKKFVFSSHDGKSCTGIAFSQVNHLLLSSCGMDGRIFFYDIT